MTAVILKIFTNFNDSALHIDSKSIYLSAMQNGMFQIDAAVNDNDIIFVLQIDHDDIAPIVYYTYDSISFCFSSALYACRIR